MVRSASPILVHLRSTRQLLLFSFASALLFYFQTTAQTLIKERVEIQPSVSRGPGLTISSTDSVYMATVTYSGRISVVDIGSLICAYKWWVLGPPVSATICGECKHDLPGQWKAGTQFSVQSVRYGVTYQVVEVSSTYYESQVWLSFRPEGSYDNLLFRVEPGTDFDHFRVRCNPDTIAFGDTTIVSVTAVDHGDQEVNFGADSLLTISASSPAEGNFISSGGALVPSPLTNVSYADAKAGKIKFVACRDSVREMVNLTVNAVSAHDPSKYGQDTLVITYFPELLIIEPMGTMVDTNITSEPRMPSLQSKAYLRGGRGTNTFNWSFALQWTNSKENPARTIRKVISETKQVQGSSVSSWSFPWGSEIRGGDVDTLSLWVMAGGRKLQKQIVSPFRIRGTNPSIAEVKNGLGLEQQVIVYKETLPKWCHFGSGRFPIFGPPHGYGLMQLDEPKATDEQVWNWMENRAGGMRRFAEARSQAATYAFRVNQNNTKKNRPVAPDLTPAQQLLDAFQNYNGYHHFYWRQKDPDRPAQGWYWKEDPPRGAGPDSAGYGRDAYRIYQAVCNGQYPPNWN